MNTVSARPKEKGEGRCTHDVVARHVRVAGVDEDADAALHKLREELRAVARAVALERERLVHLHVAALEVERGVHAERLLVLRVVHPGVEDLGEDG